ncbi:MAG: 30S ribosomal protein S7 [Acidobacteria bacterium]|nr:MAG: 30S ribosomal protein S7 [Acidobacteriota bacterium]
MPRKGHIEKREVAPDAIHDSRLVEKFINSMMWDGKKSTAQAIFYGALERVGEKAPKPEAKPEAAAESAAEGEAAEEGSDALKVFKRAVENVKPVVEVKTRRVGGANYQVPIEVNPTRRVSLAVRWIISNARGRGEKGMVDKLANEILDAANNRGGAVKKREDVHRMAEANRAFAHYRW